MKLKSKKSALLMSFTSLLLCFAMLAGSTFAWFTDTATTGVNKIVSGKLKVDIVDAANTNKSLTGEGSKLLWMQKVVSGSNETLEAVETVGLPLWEPGVNFLTQGFKIANKGNLALKWKVEVNKGTTAANEKNADLLKVIDFYVVTETTANGETTKAETPLATFEGQLKDGNSFSTETYYIKGHMQESAGNDYQNLTLDGITITVYATQLNYENDSFGPDYDKDATYLTYPAGVTKESFPETVTVGNTQQPAVAAYVDDNGEVQYVADLTSAAKAGATVVYCKENAEMKARYKDTNRTEALTGDLTIYANGANFNGGQVNISAVNGTGNTVNVNIYDAKNLSVWGQPNSNGTTYNVTIKNCSVKKDSAEGLVMYRGAYNATDKINLVVENCYVESFGTNAMDGIHVITDGTITVKNSTFKNNANGINIAHKPSGTMNVTVENCKFINCGMINPANNYRAPARFVNNNADGTLEVTLKNNTFTNTVGTNGDILLGDYRAAGKSFAFTAKIETDHAVMVKSSEGVAYSSGSAEISVVAY